MTASSFLVAVVLAGLGQAEKASADNTAASPFDKATLVWTIPWDNAWVTAVSFVGSEKRLAAGNMNGELYLWELPAPGSKTKPVPVRCLSGHEQAVTHTASMPGGRWLLSSSYDGTVRWWDMEGTVKDRREAVFDRRARAAATKKGAGKAVTFPPGPMVEVQEAAHIGQGHAEWIRSFSLNASAGKLLTGDDKGQAILWDVQERKEVGRLQVPGWLTGLGLSPDAKKIVTCQFASRYTTFKGACQVWDVRFGRRRAWPT